MLSIHPDPHTLAKARECVRLVDVSTALQWYRNQETLLVDVREPYEYGRLHIPGAILHPLSALDPATIPAADGRRLVMYCAVGVRCGHAALGLVQAGHTGPIYRIEGGISAWQAAGGPVEPGSWR